MRYTLKMSCYDIKNNTVERFDISEFQDIKGFNEAVMNYTRWEGIHDFIGLVKLNKENK